MRDARNIIDVTALSPAYMGFIFYDKSPRFVGEEFVIPRDFPSFIKRVGVFVNESADKIRSLASRLTLDFIQLHGNEPVQQCNELKAAGLKIIKVFSIDENFDFSEAKTYESVADYFLFDTKGKYYGGNAKVFDWKVLQRYDQGIPFFLSGGLSPDNVDSISELSNMNIHALDINSGVEISPGFKSIEKIKEVYEILNNIKQVNQNDIQG